MKKQREEILKKIEVVMADFKEEMLSYEEFKAGLDKISKEDLAVSFVGLMAQFSMVNAVALERCFKKEPMEKIAFSLISSIADYLKLNINTLSLFDKEFAEKINEHIEALDDIEVFKDECQEK